MILSHPDLQAFVQSGGITRPDGVPIATDLISIGLHLDHELLWYKRVHEPVVPPADLPTERVVLSATDRYHFSPGAKLLACSLERVAMPLDVMGFTRTFWSMWRRLPGVTETVKQAICEAVASMKRRTIPGCRGRSSRA